MATIFTIPKDINSAVVETGTTAVTGTFVGLLAVTDIVINTITYGNGMSGDSLNGKTILAGTYIVMGFTAITLTSGSAIYYIE